MCGLDFQRFRDSETQKGMLGGWGCRALWCISPSDPWLQRSLGLAKISEDNRDGAQKQELRPPREDETTKSVIVQYSIPIVHRNPSSRACFQTLQPLAPELRESGKAQSSHTDKRPPAELRAGNLRPNRSQQTPFR